MKRGRASDGRTTKIEDCCTFEVCKVADEKKNAGLDLHDRV
jgi:hypothetical protein